MPDLSEAEIANTDFGTYDEGQFFDDMFRVTQNRSDPDLVELLVRNSFDTMKWLHARGVHFLPAYGRQAFKVDGRFKFWGGLTVEARGGGPGVVSILTRIAQSQGVEVLYESAACGLLYDGRRRVNGVSVKGSDGKSDLRAKTVVLLAAASKPMPK
jgi:tricarballylate dehydrogenase